MKLGKTSWIILSIGIFIVIGAGLGFTRNQQLQEQKRLADELSVAEYRLNQVQVKDLYQQEEELQARLDESNAQLEAAKDSLRQTVESIDVADEFYAIAYACNVEIISITSSSWRGEIVGSVACTAITMNASVTGTLADIVNFVIMLNNDFTTGVVKSARMSIASMTAEEGAAVDVQMIVYTYQGA